MTEPSIFHVQPRQNDKYDEIYLLGIINRAEEHAFMCTRADLEGLLAQITETLEGRIPKLMAGAGAGFDYPPVIYDRDPQWRT